MGIEYYTDSFVFSLSVSSTKDKSMACCINKCKCNHTLTHTHSDRCTGFLSNACAYEIISASHLLAESVWKMASNIHINIQIQLGPLFTYEWEELNPAPATWCQLLEEGVRSHRGLFHDHWYLTPGRIWFRTLPGCWHVFWNMRKGQEQTMMYKGAWNNPHHTHRF